MSSSYWTYSYTGYTSAFTPTGTWVDCDQFPARARDPIVGTSDEGVITSSTDHYFRFQINWTDLPTRFDRVVGIEIELQADDIGSSSNEFKIYWNTTDTRTSYNFLTTWYPYTNYDEKYIDWYRKVFYFDFSPHFLWNQRSQLTGTGLYFRIYVQNISENDNVYIHAAKAKLKYVPETSMYSEVDAQISSNNVTAYVDRSQDTSERALIDGWKMYKKSVPVGVPTVTISESNLFYTAPDEYTTYKTDTLTTSGTYLYATSVLGKSGTYPDVTTFGYNHHGDYVSILVPVSGFTVSLTGTTINLSWNSQGGEEGSAYFYKIYYKAIPKGSNPNSTGWSTFKDFIATNSTTNASSPISSLTSGYAYCFKIRTHFTVSESADNYDEKMVYYVANIGNLTDVDTTDTPTPLYDNVERDSIINLAWSPPANKHASIATRYWVEVKYSATNSNPTTVISSGYSLAWQGPTLGYTGVFVTVNENGYYKFDFTLDQEDTFSYTPSEGSQGLLSYTNGGTDASSNTYVVRVADGWQGYVSDKLNPSTIGGKNFKNVIEVSDYPDKDLNPTGGEAF